MAVEITHVHLEGTPEDHQHITKYKWINNSDAKPGPATSPQWSMDRRKKGPSVCGNRPFISPSRSYQA